MIDHKPKPNPLLRIKNNRERLEDMFGGLSLDIVLYPQEIDAINESIELMKEMEELLG